MRKSKKMETAVLIEKIIEEYNSEEKITKFIELSLFVHKIFVENGHCDNSCSVLDFLVGASFRFELLSENNVGKKIFFATMPESITNNLYLHIDF